MAGGADNGAAGAVGYFGKLPLAGDFLRRAIAPAFTEPWDAWLQALITEGRAAFGPAWQDTYFTAPIWRFALPPGAAGPAAMVGTLMPSVDRVGRQFPFTLATPVETADAFAAHEACAPLYATLEEIALAMLEDGVERAWLDHRIDGLAPPPIPGLPVAALGPGAVALTASPAARTAGLAGTVLAGHLRHPAIWSCTVAGDPGRLIATDGLPRGDAALALLDLAAPLWGAPAPDPVDDILRGTDTASILGGA